jgi:hypothetical protein
MAGLDVASNVSGAAEFRWELRAPRKKLFNISGILDRLKGIAESDEEVRVLIQSKDGEMIDVESHKIIRRASVVRVNEGSKSVSPEAMYDAIRKAFRDASPELQNILNRKF